MISINSYLQNNGFEIDQERSNTKYSVYSIGTVDNENDFIDYNGNKMKLNKFICNFRNVNYYQAKKIINEFIPLIPVELSDTHYKEPIKPSDNILWDMNNRLTEQVVALQTYITMVKHYQETFGAEGFHYLQTVNIDEYMNDSPEYRVSMDKAVIIDRNVATPLELKHFPNYNEEIRKENNKLAAIKAGKAYLEASMLYNQAKIITYERELQDS